MKGFQKIAAVIAVLSLLLVGGCKKQETDTLTVKLNDYVQFTATGTNGNGVVEYAFDIKGFAEDYADKIKPEKAISKKYDKDEIPNVFFEKCVNAILSKSEKIKNDEVVTLQWDCDDKKAKNDFHIKLQYSDINYKVKNLDAGITDFVGRSYNDLSSDDFAAYDDLEIAFEPSNKYSNGVITDQYEKIEDGKHILVLTVSNGPENGQESSDSNESTYVRLVDDISDEAFHQMDATLRDRILEVNFDSDKEVADEISLYKVIVLYSDTQQPRNEVYFVYSVRAHNPVQTGGFTWYGGYSNVQNVNGKTEWQQDSFFEIEFTVKGLVFESDEDTGGYWYYGAFNGTESLFEYKIFDMLYNGYVEDIKEFY